MWHPVLIQQQQAIELVQQIQEEVITAPQYIPAVCPECEGKSPETCGFCGDTDDE